VPNCPEWTVGALVRHIATAVLTGDESVLDAMRQR
jgi:hypothetical protein